jgi:short subunit dehydrogenase-like uncharacterized protein
MGPTAIPASSSRARPRPIAALAGELGLEHRVADLENRTRLDGALAGVAAVLHCAGPFSRTSRLMLEACLRAKAHYLDITGEIPVFERAAARDGDAKGAGVMLLPGCGFDVVPSDCLASHLHRRLPSATDLALGLRTTGGPSRGTSLTLVEQLPHGGAVRRGGKIVPVPPAWQSREIDFGDARLGAITIPWGDVATAWHSTGIPNIEVYLALPPAQRFAARASRYFNWALRSKPVQSVLRGRIRDGAAGPSAAERARTNTVVWGEARDGNSVVASRLFGPDGYTTTVRTALEIVARVLAGEAPPGFQTPSKAYGADFILGIEGYRREDIPS